MKSKCLLLLLPCLLLVSPARLSLAPAAAPVAVAAPAAMPPRAEPVLIDGPDKLAASAARLYVVRGLLDWKDCIVKVLPENSGAVAAKLTGDDGPVIYLQAPESSATLFLLVDVNKTGAFALAAKTITVGGGDKQNPPPGPVDPPTPPEPQTLIPPGHLWLIVVVADPTQVTPGQTAIRSNKELRSLIDNRGDHLRWFGPNSAPEAAAYIERAKRDGLPRALIVSDAAGETATTNVKSSIPLGEDAGPVVAEVKKWGGYNGE